MATETLSIIVAAGSMVFGIFSWFTSGVLKDKGKIIEHDVEIRNLKDKFNRLEERINGEK